MQLDKAFTFSPRLGGIDLQAVTFDLDPPYTHQIIASDTPTQFSFVFTYEILKSPEASSPDPTSFNYELVLSDAADSSSLRYTVVEDTDEIWTDMDEKTVKGDTMITLFSS